MPAAGTAYTVAQLAVPSFRESAELKASAPWFIATCLLQAVWSVAFAAERIYLSLGLIIGITLTLWRINVRLRAVKINSTTTSWTRYLLFHLPMSIHFGWLTAASIVAVNLTLVFTRPHAHATLLCAAVVSLTAAFIPALIDPATGRVGSDPAYALTIGWALAGVAAQNASPLREAPAADPIQVWCPPLVTDALSAVAATLSAAVVLTTLLRLFARACARAPCSWAGEIGSPILHAGLVVMEPGAKP